MYILVSTVHVTYNSTLQEQVRLAKLSQAREERQRIIYLDVESEAAKIPRYLLGNDVERSRSASPTKRSPSKVVKKVAWDSSTKGAELELRTSLEMAPDAIVSSPVKAQKSWVESLRSPELIRRSSTPILDKSCDDLSVIGSRNRIALRTKSAKRSKSVPRGGRKASGELGRLTSKSETRLSSSTELNRSYNNLQNAHKQLTANVTQLESELKVRNVYNSVYYFSCYSSFHLTS